VGGNRAGNIWSPFAGSQHKVAKAPSGRLVQSDKP